MEGTERGPVGQGAHTDLLEALEVADWMIVAGRTAEARAWLRVVKKLEIQRRNGGAK